jgi:hypothetical protein
MSSPFPQEVIFLNDHHEESEIKKEWRLKSPFLKGGDYNLFLSKKDSQVSIYLLIA